MGRGLLNTMSTRSRGTSMKRWAVVVAVCFVAMVLLVFSTSNLSYSSQQASEQFRRAMIRLDPSTFFTASDQAKDAESFPSSTAEDGSQAGTYGADEKIFKINDKNYNVVDDQNKTSDDYGSKDYESDESGSIYDRKDDYDASEEIQNNRTGTPFEMDGGISKKRRFSTGQNFVEAIDSCKDFDCIRDAHAEIDRPDGVHPFPAFLILGWQKSATTSLHLHFSRHPALMKSTVKEPEFLTYSCEFNPPESCPTGSELEWYIDDVLQKPMYVSMNGTKMVYESSTHMVRGGQKLSPALRKMMPWLKLILQMREPISRAASLLIHNLDKGRGCMAEGNQTLAHCLLTESQIRTEGGYLLDTPQGPYAPTNYNEVLKPWLENWPAEQLHIIQYEELTDEETQISELRRVKEFLEINKESPKKYKTLDLKNSRKFDIRPEGWPMLRSEYQKLVDIARKDVMVVLDLLEKHGLLRDRGAWLQRWEDVWTENLENCEEGPDGKCSILLS